MFSQEVNGVELVYLVYWNGVELILHLHWRALWKKKDKFKKIILPFRKIVKIQKDKGDNLNAFRPKQQTG